MGGLFEPEYVTVSSGQFTGEMFDGSALWLEIGVHPGIEIGDYTASIHLAGHFGTSLDWAVSLPSRYQPRVC